jgi:hypothetical protein
MRGEQQRSRPLLWPADYDDPIREQPPDELELGLRPLR